MLDGEPKRIVNRALRTGVALALSVTPLAPLAPSQTQELSQITPRVENRVARRDDEEFQFSKGSEKLLPKIDGDGNNGVSRDSQVLFRRYSGPSENFYHQEAVRI